MKPERYTIKQFNAQFPTDAACLEFIFQKRFPDGGLCKCGKKDSFYRVARRRCYSCAHCGHQVSPCEGTIFHKSSTALRSWFFAMFLMTSSKNGVSAKELERHVGVTYKTAWRMAHQIRKLMKQGGGLLTGVVEADETYIGGYRRMSAKMENKKAVVAVVQRGGEIRTKAVVRINSWQLKQVLDANLSPSAHLITDELSGYRRPGKAFASHQSVNHGHKEYVRAEVHTNSVEGFWSQLKRSVNGTFHHVSRQHLQGYVDEFAFRYNRRAAVQLAPIFRHLSERVAERHVAVN